MAQYLSQRAGHILLLQWSGQKSGRASFFPKFSYSHRPASISNLVDPPILPAWPISIYLKHDWQNTDNYLTPLGGGSGLEAGQVSIQQGQDCSFSIFSDLLNKPVLHTNLHNVKTLSLTPWTTTASPSEGTRDPSLFIHRVVHFHINPKKWV